MKAVILAAGEGERMRPLTLTTPKPMIKLHGKPYLEWILDEIVESGIMPENIGVVVEYKKEQIEDYFRKHPVYSVITIINQDPERRGTGGATLACRNFTGNEDFLLLMGDMMYSRRTIDELAKLKDAFCYVGVFRVSLEEAHKYGVMRVDGDFVIEILEKPKSPPDNLINAAIYKLTSEIYGALENVSPHEKDGRTEYWITDAFRSLGGKGGKVKWHEAEMLFDLGCPDDIPKAEEILSRL